MRKKNMVDLISIAVIKEQSTSDLLGRESKAEGKAEEAALDEALRETFPASDPIAVTITPEVKVVRRSIER